MHYSCFLNEQTCSCFNLPVKPQRWVESTIHGVDSPKHALQPLRSEIARFLSHRICAHCMYGASNKHGFLYKYRGVPERVPLHRDHACSVSGSEKGVSTPPYSVSGATSYF